MSDAAISDEPAPAELRAQAGVDLRGGAGWVVLGIAVLVASLRMDRLERQGVHPYTVPGLLPGLLGIAMVVLGSVLALRSWQRGARFGDRSAAAMAPGSLARLTLVLGLCLTFGVLLVGHGLPFWLAGALYVSVAIVSLQAPQRAALGRGLSARDVITAVVIGLGAGGVITLVFQRLFLVRLP